MAAANSIGARPAFIWVVFIHLGDGVRSNTLFATFIHRDKIIP